MEKSAALALFDFDGTLIPGDSIAAYARFARKRKAMTIGEYAGAIWAALQYLLGRMDARASKSAALSFRKRMGEKEREALDRAFVTEILLPRVYPEGKKCLISHKKEGRLPVLVTASTENYMRVVAEALGFSAVLATPLNPDGSVGENCRGEEKVRRISAWLREQGIRADFAASYAYGDSKSDLPMMRLCGHPVQANPKKALRKAAPNMEKVCWHR